MPENQEMISIDKITVNIGVGNPGKNLEKAKELLERITGSTPVKTRGKGKVPQWGVREGKAIGVKTTLRDEEAEKFLEKAFEAKGNQVERKNFDERGNLSFGIDEYIDLPDQEYDPEKGIYGLDVNVTMDKWGYRVKERKINPSKIPEKHILTKDESADYLENNFNVEVKE